MIWIKSSDSERGQLWDYPGSLHTMHLKHLFLLSSEPCLTSLGFFPSPRFILPSSAEEKVPSTGTENPWTAERIPQPFPCPMSPVITPWAGPPSLQSAVGAVCSLFGVREHQRAVPGGK